MKRREFLYRMSTVLPVLHPSLRAFAAEPVSTIRLRTEATVASVPSDVMGLSYESTQLGEPDFFSAENTGLVRLFQRLSPAGILRLGGNTSEFTWFSDRDADTAPAYTPLPTQPAALTRISRGALHNLRGFLNETGWRCMYGLNLGTGTPERAAAEAAAVVEILGPALKYLQIGNEPNNYIRYKLRSSAWNPNSYVDEWLRFAKAILARVPEARLAGPDMGADLNWMETFVHRVSPFLGKNLVEITDHFYAEGPPASPEADIRHLLFNTKINHEIDVMRATSRLSSLPCRMTEVNSCYLGGKPGVSNTMAAALWAADLTLQLVMNGFSGVNFHGGSARQIKASLGGTLPGDSVAKGTAADSYYTPIAGNPQEGFTIRPIFYGMMLSAQLAGSRLIQVDSNASQARIYAGIENHRGALSILAVERLGNRSQLRLILPPGYSTGTCDRLEAPAVDAATGLQLTRSSISPTEQPGQGIAISLAPYSAVLLRFPRPSPAANTSPKRG